MCECVHVCEFVCVRVCVRAYWMSLGKGQWLVTFLCVSIAQFQTLKFLVVRLRGFKGEH